MGVREGKVSVCRRRWPIKAGEEADDGNCIYFLAKKKKENVQDKDKKRAFFPRSDDFKRTKIKQILNARAVAEINFAVYMIQTMSFDAVK